VVEILKRLSLLRPVRTIEPFPSPSILMGARYDVRQIRLPMVFGTIGIIISFLRFVAISTWYLLVEKDRYDIIMTGSSNLSEVAPGFFASKILRKPFVTIFQLTSYASSYAEEYRLIKNSERGLGTMLKAISSSIVIWMTRSASALCCLSKSIEDVLKSLRYEGSMIHWIGAGIAHGEINSVPSDRKKYDSVFLGRIEVAKGVNDIINAWKIVCREIDSAKLAFIGRGAYLSEAKALVAREGLSNSVEFLGFIGGVERFSYLKESKISLYPSKMLGESWGHSITESLACGLPVICSDRLVFRKEFSECRSVFFIPIGDVQGIANRVLQLLGDGNFSEYEKISKEFALEFEWDHVVSRLEKVLDKISR